MNSLSDENIGEVSDFAEPQYLKNLIEDIKEGKRYAVSIYCLMIRKTGYDSFSLEDYFDAEDIEDDDKIIMRMIDDQCTIVEKNGDAYPVPDDGKYLWLYPFSIDDYTAILFVKNRDIFECIDFDY